MRGGQKHITVLVRDTVTCAIGDVYIRGLSPDLRDKCVPFSKPTRQPQPRSDHPNPWQGNAEQQNPPKKSPLVPKRLEQEKRGIF